MQKGCETEVSLFGVYHCITHKCQKFPWGSHLTMLLPPCHAYHCNTTDTSLYQAHFIAKELVVRIRLVNVAYVNLLVFHWNVKTFII